ncbi:MAG TPA: anti-sigma factor, partial [Streptosporangiaceae bacterium]
CPECTRMLASYREVAAAIASVVPPAAEPSPQLADRIMASVRAGLDPSRAPAPAAQAAGATPAEHAGTAPAEQTAGQPDSTPEAPAQQDTPAEVVPLRQRRRWLRPATAAAAAALIAGGGIWAGLAASSGGSSQPTVANCQPQHGCFQTALSSVATHQPTAKVLVQGKTVWMVPTGIKADNTADQIYVLWQIVGKHLHALGGFDIHPSGTGTEIEIGKLAAPYHGTTDFAISLEPGRTVPAAPTKVVALGAVS